MKKFSPLLGTIALTFCLTLGFAPGSALAEQSEQSGDGAVSIEEILANTETQEAPAADQVQEGAEATNSVSDQATTDQTEDTSIANARAASGEQINAAVVEQAESLSTQATSTYYVDFTATPSVSSATAKPSVTLNMTFRDSTYAYGYDQNVKSYVIKRSTTSQNGPFTQVYSKTYPSYFSSYTDTGLAFGQTYYYKIEYTRNDGSTYSKGVAVITPPASLKSLNYELASANSIKLSWNKTAGATGYYIYEAKGWNDPTKNNNTFSYTNWPTKPTYTINYGTTTSFTATKLEYGKPYFYKIVAFAKNGSIIASTTYASPIVCAYTAPAQTKVTTSLTTTNNNYVSATQKAYIRWDLKTENWYLSGGQQIGYIVEKSTDNKNWSTIATITKATVNNYTDSSIALGTTYYYRVTPYIKNSNGKTTKSAVSSAVALKTLPAAGNIVGYQKNSDSSYTLSWNKVTGADGYMMWAFRSGGKWTKLQELPASATSVKVNDLTSGKLYGVACVPYVKNGSNVSYGTANKTWMLDRRKGANKIYMTTLGNSGTTSSVKTGWQEISGSWYYFRGDGSMVIGWMKSGSKWYYMNSNGVMLKGKQTIGNAKYYFNSSGAMITGWNKEGNTWYYYTGSGAMKTGWLKSGGKWYYFNGNGAMLTGKQAIGNAKYYFNSSGAMKTGWNQEGNTWYYYTGSGAMKTGWLKSGGKWYYFNGNGAMLTGKQTIDKATYFFNSSGAMRTGWIQDGGNWYYCNSSGAMQKDKWIGKYYVKSNGVMAKNEWIGKYHVNADGKWDQTK